MKTIEALRQELFHTIEGIDAQLVWDGLPLECQEEYKDGIPSSEKAEPWDSRLILALIDSHPDFAIALSRLVAKLIARGLEEHRKEVEEFRNSEGGRRIAARMEERSKNPDLDIREALRAIDLRLAEQQASAGDKTDS